jgi:tRNA intron endonuclease, catalytic C-terminal domain
LKDENVEIRNQDDIEFLYLNGFYGKGAISRRFANNEITRILLTPSVARAISLKYGHLAFVWKYMTSHHDLVERILMMNNEKASKRQRLDIEESSVVVPDSTLDFNVDAASEDETDLVKVDSDVESGGENESESALDLDNPLSAESTIESIHQNIKLDDFLTKQCEEFEKEIDLQRNDNLLDAYEAGAFSFTHQYELLSFQSSCVIAKYVTCPPKRLSGKEIDIPIKYLAQYIPEVQSLPETEDELTRALFFLDLVKAMFRSSDASSRDSSNPSFSTKSLLVDEHVFNTFTESEATELFSLVSFSLQNSAPISSTLQLDFYLLQPESAILEPEAVCYLLEGRNAHINLQVVSSPSSNSNESSPLSLQDVWTIFCTRIPNFLARYATFRHFRALGWVVRDAEAFGADWALYKFGPGRDHSPAVVSVLPLRVICSKETVLRVVDEDDLIKSNDKKEKSVTNPTTTTLIRHMNPELQGGRTWLDVHGTGRVVSGAKKKLLFSQVTYMVPPSVPTISIQLNSKKHSTNDLVPFNHQANAVSGNACSNDLRVELDMSLSFSIYLPIELSTKILMQPVQLTMQEVHLGITSSSRWMFSLESMIKGKELAHAIQMHQQLSSLNDFDKEVEENNGSKQRESKLSKGLIKQASSLLLARSSALAAASSNAKGVQTVPGQGKKKGDTVSSLPIVDLVILAHAWDDDFPTSKKEQLVESIVRAGKMIPDLNEALETNEAIDFSKLPSCPQFRTRVDEAVAALSKVGGSVTVRAPKLPSRSWFVDRKSWCSFDVDASSPE